MSPMSFQVESVAVPRSELVKVLRQLRRSCWQLRRFWNNGRCRMALKIWDLITKLWKPYCFWGSLSFLDNAQISQMELKELSVMALESRKLYMGASWNLQSSNPRPLTEATTYNSNRKFTHEMAEDTGIERWAGANIVVLFNSCFCRPRRTMALMVKYQVAWVKLDLDMGKNPGSKWNQGATGI